MEPEDPKKAKTAAEAYAIAAEIVAELLGFEDVPAVRVMEVAAKLRELAAVDEDGETR